MNKSELIKAIVKKSNLTQKDAVSGLNALTAIIQETLAKDESVSLMGFGTFEVQERPARIGRNPATGAEIQIAASKSPRFKAGKMFKIAISQHVVEKAEAVKTSKKISKK